MDADTREMFTASANVFDPTAAARRAQHHPRADNTTAPKPAANSAAATRT